MKKIVTTLIILATVWTSVVALPAWRKAKPTNNPTALPSSSFSGAMKACITLLSPRASLLCATRMVITAMHK